MPSSGEGRPLPLGEVLVRHGVVSEEQLEAALERQRETGRPLGEIVVELGYAPGPIVAQALATQRGGLLKTEYGFATGWRDPDAPAGPPPAPDPAAELAARDRSIAQLQEWAARAQAAIAARDRSIADLQATLAELRGQAPAAGADAGLQAEADELRDALRAAKEEAASAAAATAGLERALAEARAQVQAAAERTVEAEELRDALRTAKEEAASAAAARAEAERALADLRGRSEQQAGELERRTASLADAQADLERRLENASSRAGTLARRVAEQEEELAALRARPAAPADRWASATRHTLLVRGVEGYDLVEREGPPPAVGETVDGRRVARVAAPPVPGPAVPCAYLAD